jgi:hypothetical protein
MRIRITDLAIQINADPDADPDPQSCLVGSDKIPLLQDYHRHVFWCTTKVSLSKYIFILNIFLF